MTATNTALTPTVIAKEALMLLDNNLVMGKLVHRGYEEEVTQQVNGYKKGGQVTIRRPAKYTWRSGAVAQPQDSTEKSFTVTVGTQGGVDLQFSSVDMTLKISDFSERFLKSAMITVANRIDSDIYTEAYRSTWNWVGTPGQTINSFSDFGKAPQRLTEMAVPEDRVGVLSPDDKWGLLGSVSGLYIQDAAKDALVRAKLPAMGGIDLYESQIVKTHTVGTKAGASPVVNLDQSTTYAAAGGTNSMTLNTTAWTGSSAILKRGDVFTIGTLAAGVRAINPVTKDVMPYLQQFVVNEDISSESDTTAAINISPAIITSGAYQTVSGAALNNQAITVLGTASTGYTQNLVFHKNAFGLIMVPMEVPAGVPSGLVGRETYKGISVRLIPYYDGTNDISNWRLDVLYTVKAIYPDLATRVSGT